MITYQDKTKVEWLDHIDSIKWLDVIPNLINKVIPNAKFSFKKDPELDRYDRLVMENKPSRQQLKDELIEWKSEESERIMTIFSELELEKAFLDRIKAIQDLEDWQFLIRDIVKKPNPKKHLKEIFEARDEVELDLIESAIPSAQAKLQAMKDKEQAREDRNQNAKNFIKDLKINAMTNADKENLLKVVALYLKDRLGNN